MMLCVFNEINKSTPNVLIMTDWRISHLLLNTQSVEVIAIKSNLLLCFEPVLTLQ